MNGKFKKLGTDPRIRRYSLVGCGGIRWRKRRRSTDEVKGDCKTADLGAPDASMCKGAKDGSFHHIKKGSLVEVLSQDSGIRGCWFRALIIKKHKDKVKVQYQDIKDADDDESKKLEEWILASRVAASDHMGLRNTVQKIIGPNRSPAKINDVWAVGVGMPDPVDGCEKKISAFHRSDLRQSLDWSADEWIHIKSRSDLVSSILSLMKKKEVEMKHDEKQSEGCGGDGVMSPKGEAKQLSSSSYKPTTNKASTKPPVLCYDHYVMIQLQSFVL